MEDKAVVDAALERDHLVLERVYGVLDALLQSDAVNRATVSVDTSLADLGIDSIAYLSLVLSIGELVNADLDELVARIDRHPVTTVGDIVDLIKFFEK